MQVCIRIHPVVLSTMSAVMMLALLLGVFVCMVKSQLPPSSCSNDPCFHPPMSVLPEGKGTSEGEAIVTLTCFLDCKRSNTEVGQHICLFIVSVNKLHAVYILLWVMKYDFSIEHKPYQNTHLEAKCYYCRYCSSSLCN